MIMQAAKLSHCHQRARGMFSTLTVPMKTRAVHGQQSSFFSQTKCKKQQKTNNNNNKKKLNLQYKWADKCLIITLKRSTYHWSDVHVHNLTLTTRPAETVASAGGLVTNGNRPLLSWFVLHICQWKKKKQQKKKKKQPHTHKTRRIELFLVAFVLTIGPNSKSPDPIAHLLSF